MGHVRRYRSRDSPDMIVVKLRSSPAFLYSEADLEDMSLRVNPVWLRKQDRECNLGQKRRSPVRVGDGETRAHPRRSAPHVEEIRNERDGK
jgi:hypothetical protein